MIALKPTEMMRVKIAPRRDNAIGSADLKHIVIFNKITAQEYFKILQVYHIIMGKNSYYFRRCCTEKFQIGC